MKRGDQQSALSIGLAKRGRPQRSEQGRTTNGACKGGLLEVVGEALLWSLPGIAIGILLEIAVIASQISSLMKALADAL